MKCLCPDGNEPSGSVMPMSLREICNRIYVGENEHTLRKNFSFNELFQGGQDTNSKFKCPNCSVMEQATKQIIV